MELVKEAAAPQAAAAFEKGPTGVWFADLQGRYLPLPVTCCIAAFQTNCTKRIADSITISMFGIDCEAVNGSEPTDSVLSLLAMESILA